MKFTRPAVSKGIQYSAGYLKIIRRNRDKNGKNRENINKENKYLEREKMGKSEEKMKKKE